MEDDTGGTHGSLRERPGGQVQAPISKRTREVAKAKFDLVSNGEEAATSCSSDALSAVINNRLAYKHVSVD